MSKIYTRTGDKGETSLYTGKRVPKNSVQMEALGLVDECNSTIGMALSFFSNETLCDDVKKMLLQIQHTLFDLGAAIATPRDEASEKKLKKTSFDVEAIKQLEVWMDQMEADLPPLTNFILPGGHPAGATLHLARTVCRSSERAIITLLHSGSIADEPLIYLNRLSDFLFMAARHLNHRLNVPETIWAQH
jgi:cob(I)alamin adenosyltransferase